MGVDGPFRIASLASDAEYQAVSCNSTDSMGE
jgi:hypothetical protein